MKTATRAKTALQSKTVSILGSTGSIGCNTLDVVSQHPARYSIKALTAFDNVDVLIEQAKKYRPSFVAIGNEAHYGKLKEALASLNCTVAAGLKALEEAAEVKSDIVMSAIVGAAGLAPTLTAIRRGATVALANKECLVCAGELMTKEITRHGATLIPVDSEHNAIFQVFDFEQPETVERVTITASGGPFREYSLEQMKSVTPEQAVKHPNWNMGAKISVDSATMMNKGLEAIEAFHLFPLKADQIEVLIHPESIIHSLVSYHDGSVLAQLGMPDMRTPIAYALAYPERITSAHQRLNLAALGKLTFFKPDGMRFPALGLARRVMEAGGSAPVVMNAANEIAVEAFLKKRIAFLDIVPLIETVLAKNKHTAPGNIDDILTIDCESRKLAQASLSS